MADFNLHCFALSGNSYKVALFLNLANLDWNPIFVDYLGGETKSIEWRRRINKFGEVPVLEHGGLKICQSAVILNYLTEITSQFGPKNEYERREILEWLFFDNHKFTSYYATLRYMYGLESKDNEVTDFLRNKVQSAFEVVDHHLIGKKFMVSNRITVVDISMAGYIYMPEQIGLDLEKYKNIEAWKKRIMKITGWKHPYELMPGPTAL